MLLGDNNAAAVQGIGTINVKAYGGTVKVLTNVRYILKLKRNLISTGTLDMLGFKHSGGEGKTRFYKNGKLALQGTLTGSLYLFDGKTIAGQVNISVQKKTLSLSRDETSLWHK